MATHCSHNSNSVGNQGTTSKSKLLMANGDNFGKSATFPHALCIDIPLGRTLTVPIFRLVSLTSFLKRFNPRRIDRWGGLLRAAKVLVATRKRDGLDQGPI